MQDEYWQPTLKWHVKLLAVLAGLTVCAFFALKYITGVLPKQYQPKKPAPQTTPWLKR